MTPTATLARGAAEHTAQNVSSTNDIEAAFDCYSRALYRYVIVRAGEDAHLADDVMQQVWLAALAKDPAVPPDQMEFWLRRVAKNILAARWRRLANRPAHVPLADAALAGRLAQQLESEQMPVDLLDRREVRDQLMLALTELPGSDQDLLIDRYFRGRSVAELAEACRATARAVEGRLYRARGALRKALTELEE